VGSEPAGVIKGIEINTKTRRYLEMELVTNTPINPTDVYRMIDSSKGGSVVFHFAVVRGTTGEKKTDSVEFRVAKDNEDTLRELRTISDELRDNWEIDDVLIIRATGILKVGDAMSLVAASSPHREAAFGASSHGVEKLKKMKTIIKNEVFI
jgi:molybdopterin synthase catalytic subunit